MKKVVYLFFSVICLEHVMVASEEINRVLAKVTAKLAVRKLLTNEKEGDVRIIEEDTIPLDGGSTVRTNLVLEADSSDRDDNLEKTYYSVSLIRQGRFKKIVFNFAPNDTTIISR